MKLLYQDMSLDDLHVGALGNLVNLFNLLIALIGGGMLAVGAILYLEVSDMGPSLNNEIAPSMIVLGALGGILILTSLVGLVGVCKKQSLLIVAFLAAMTVAILAQYAVVVIMFLFQAGFSYFLNSGMDHSLKYYGKEAENVRFTEAWDYLQVKFDCCGKFGWEDYGSTNASDWFSTKAGSLPDTCCFVGGEEGCGEGAIAGLAEGTPPTGFFLRGCYDVTKTWLGWWLLIVGIAVLVFVVVEILAVFLNIHLQMRYREHEDYQLQSNKVKHVKVPGSKVTGSMGPGSVGPGSVKEKSISDEV